MIYLFWVFLALARGEEILITALTSEKVVELDKEYSPEVIGDVLYIKGRIGSNIYDYIAREQLAMRNVRVVELDSLGGNLNWGLDIAAKLRSLNITTRVSQGHFCASACVFIYSAGRTREASSEAWFGIHAARPSVNDKKIFEEVCFLTVGGDPVFVPNLKECKAFMDDWYPRVLSKTLNAFDFMETGGVSPLLRADYFALPQDAQWYKRTNIVKTAEWVLPAVIAKNYFLVTKIIN